MQKIINILLILFINTISYNLYSQGSYNNVDSVGERHGFWETEKEIYCKKKKNDECIIIVLGKEKGMYSHGEKTGFWTIIDNKGRLFKQELYENNILKLVIEYKKNKILSIAIVECFEQPYKNKNIKSVCKIIDVTFFNKNGKAKKRDYKYLDKIITEKY